MANLYDLKKFDLNLLVIFECIYQHLSISKAAETLFITPSAVSQSLQRLRNQLNDPLFIRSGKGITPTTVGTNLHIHLEQNLNQLEQTINIMHGSKLTKNFVIYCPQLVTPQVMLEPMMRLMDLHNYEIELHDLLLAPDSTESLLAYRKADLVFSFAPVQNRSIVCTPFKTLPFTLVCRNDHPRINGKIEIEDLLQEKFTAFLSEEPGVKDYQQKMNHKLSERNIVFRSDSFMSILAMISASDLVGVAPETTFEQFGKVLNLKRVEVDYKLPPVEIYMMYNRSALNSPVFADFIENSLA